MLTNLFACGTDQPQAEQKLKMKVVAAEAASAYHCCTHSLSYNSQDCANKLYQSQFSDSANAIATSMKASLSKFLNCSWKLRTCLPLPAYVADNGKQHRRIN